MELIMIRFKGKNVFMCVSNFGELKTCIWESETVCPRNLNWLFLFIRRWPHPLRDANIFWAAAVDTLWSLWMHWTRTKQARILTAWVVQSDRTECEKSDSSSEQDFHTQGNIGCSWKHVTGAWNPMAGEGAPGQEMTLHLGPVGQVGVSRRERVCQAERTHLAREGFCEAQLLSCFQVFILCWFDMATRSCLLLNL